MLAVGVLAVGVLACATWVFGVARHTMTRRGEAYRISYEPARAKIGRRAPLAGAGNARRPHERTGAGRRPHARRGAGRQLLARVSIVGGADASIANFPFQVALYDLRAGSPAAGFFCGGVILDATHVATAAHCVVGGMGRSARASGEVAVLAGSSSLNSLAPGSVRDPVRFSTFDSHYNPTSSDYDVALLTLGRPLWSGPVAPSLNGQSTIAPLPLDADGGASHANPDSTPTIIATASGWGNVNPEPGHVSSYPTSLRSVRMPLVSDPVCGEQYSAIEQSITPRMICAGGGRTHVDTCYGDSGGPLVVDRDTPAHPPGDYVLAGLVDFGNGCAQNGYAGVYTRISNPDIMRFLTSGIGHPVRPVGVQAKHKKKRKKPKPKKELKKPKHKKQRNKRHRQRRRLAGK